MPKSLKEENSWQLWIFIMANVAAFYAARHWTDMRFDDMLALLKTAPTFVSVGVAGVVATAINAFLSADLKAVLVYWRLKNVLPGHRAFTIYALKDPRVDMERLHALLGGKLPNDPGEQNKVWYGLYNKVKDEVRVRSSHKVFLFLRDATCISLVCLIVFGPWAWLTFPDRSVIAWYGAFLLLQSLVIRQGAFNSGIRCVTNVLVITTHQPHTLRDTGAHGKSKKVASRIPEKCRALRSSVTGRANEQV